jgi:hypothetical protein
VDSVQENGQPANTFSAMSAALIKQLLEVGRRFYRLCWMPFYALGIKSTVSEIGR